MKFTVTEVLPKYNKVYHSGYSFGTIYKAIESIKEKADSKNKELTLCWSGTLVHVKPGDSSGEIYNNWSLGRNDYQRLSLSYHWALCPVCSPREEEEL